MNIQIQNILNKGINVKEDYVIQMRGLRLPAPFTQILPENDFIWTAFLPCCLHPKVNPPQPPFFKGGRMKSPPPDPPFPKGGIRMYLCKRGCVTIENGSRKL